MANAQIITRGFGPDGKIITRGYGLALVFTVGDAPARRIGSRGGSGRKYEVEYDINKRLPYGQYRVTAQLIGSGSNAVVADGDTGIIYFDESNKANVIVTRIDAEAEPADEVEILVSIRDVTII